MPSFFVVCGDSCAAQAAPVLFGAAAGLLWLTWDRERQGEDGALLPGTVRSSLPAAVSRYFRLWNGQAPSLDGSALLAFLLRQAAWWLLLQSMGRGPLVPFLFRPLRGMFPPFSILRREPVEGRP